METHSKIQWIGAVFAFLGEHYYFATPVCIYSDVDGIGDNQL